MSFFIPLKKTGLGITHVLLDSAIWRIAVAYITKSMCYTLLHKSSICPCYSVQGSHLCFKIQIASGSANQYWRNSCSFQVCPQFTSPPMHMIIYSTSISRLGCRRGRIEHSVLCLRCLWIQRFKVRFSVQSCQSQTKMNL